jgi:hypothetical protein
MTINPALLSLLAALCGALVGGGTSFVSTVYSQRLQVRRERVARELVKREAVLCPPPRPSLGSRGR